MTPFEYKNLEESGQTRMKSITLKERMDMYDRDTVTHVKAYYLADLGWA